jgi:hypothetical protein
MVKFSRRRYSPRKVYSAISIVRRIIPRDDDDPDDDDPDDVKACARSKQP